MSVDSTTAVVSSLTLLSAGLQRLVQVCDGPIARLTYWYLKARRHLQNQQSPGQPVTDISQVDPTRLSQGKGKMIILLTVIAGTAISYYLRLDELQGIFPHELSVASNFVFGLMISGGCEGTNSVIKYLQAAKDSKQNTVGS